MKLQLISNPTRQFDVPSDVAEILLLWQGCPVEAVPRPPAPRVAKTTWSVGRSMRTREPVITCSCATCKSGGNFMGPTAHKTQNFIHCNGPESIPADIVKQYEQLLKERRKSHE